MVASSLVLLALTLPSRMIWAWERPEDLSFVDPSRVGVVYLAATLRLGDGDDVEALARLQALVVPKDALVIPVVRVEIPLERSPSLSTRQRRQVVAAIGAVVPFESVPALQIDFDARLSERDFYRAMLEDIRSALPADAFLSMTALASWCLNDDWLRALPIDEAVPMLFRMGDTASTIRKNLSAGDDFVSPVCRGSAGVSTDEPITALPSGRRYYIFRPAIWDSESLSTVMTRIERAER